MADDARHGEDVPATLRTARLTGRGMRERCGIGNTIFIMHKITGNVLVLPLTVLATGGG